MHSGATKGGKYTRVNEVGVEEVHSGSTKCVWGSAFRSNEAGVGRCTQVQRSRWGEVQRSGGRTQVQRRRLGDVHSGPTK